ncbi:MAG: cytochrome bc complex cytochrome b subunit [Candidatus Viridilinea halotolerans]|uniref:Cytochrome bc complex cytochrome b subunit n=1 Tax=Candidatus Viridilinea halotolerans TaxID=2491704 RepID=A0A426U867_9CHLR|nr:MAG: cytochrome bc complex cytochrome b subunit [Candidatus Viridilinea halotolerans]
MAWFTRFVNSMRPRLPNDERGRMRAVANNLILHLHPTRVPAPALQMRRTWGLGGISALLTVILVLSGILLMFRYDASIERAYQSIQFLETAVPFGSLLRAIHHWSGNLLVITVTLHLVRVFFTGGFYGPRRSNWIFGLALLLLVLFFNFTGYLLPWDQLAFWAITVGVGLLDYVPLLGEAMATFLLGGREVGQAALRNFYALHVAVLPALLMLMLSYHFWRVRKDGGIALPTPSGPVEKLTTIPHLVGIELGVALLTLTALLGFAMLVPAPLEELANPAHPPNPAKAAWYFLGLQELLLHMHPLAAMLLSGSVMLGLAAVPYWDRDEAAIGIVGRSARGREAGLVGFLLSLLITPSLVVIDEWWLDLPSLLPTWSTLITNGVLPLALSLAGLALIYALLRYPLRARPSEALVGLFSFIGGALVVLTVVGVFLRGPDMVLMWP